MTTEFNPEQFYLHILRDTWSLRIGDIKEARLWAADRIEIQNKRLEWAKKILEKWEKLEHIFYTHNFSGEELGDIEKDWKDLIDKRDILIDELNDEVGDYEERLKLVKMDKNRRTTETQEDAGTAGIPPDKEYGDRKVWVRGKYVLSQDEVRQIVRDELS